VAILAAWLSVVLVRSSMPLLLPHSASALKEWMRLQWAEARRASEETFEEAPWIRELIALQSVAQSEMVQLECPLLSDSHQSDRISQPRMMGQREKILQRTRANALLDLPTTERRCDFGLRPLWMARSLDSQICWRRSSARDRTGRVRVANRTLPSVKRKKRRSPPPLPVLTP